MITSEEQYAQPLNIDEIRFQRRYVQARLNELKQEREALVVKKQDLDSQLARHRVRKQDNGVAKD